jgi:hypothetical protein
MNKKYLKRFFTCTLICRETCARSLKPWSFWLRIKSSFYWTPPSTLSIVPPPPSESKSAMWPPGGGGGRQLPKVRPFMQDLTHHYRVVISRASRIWRKGEHVIINEGQCLEESKHGASILAKPSHHPATHHTQPRCPPGPPAHPPHPYTLTHLIKHLPHQTPTLHHTPCRRTHPSPNPTTPTRPQTHYTHVHHTLTPHTNLRIHLHTHPHTPKLPTFPLHTHHILPTHHTATHNLGTKSLFKK